MPNDKKLLFGVVGNLTVPICLKPLPGVQGRGSSAPAFAKRDTLFIFPSMSKCDRIISFASYIRNSSQKVWEILCCWFLNAMCYGKDETGNGSGYTAQRGPKRYPRRSQTDFGVDLHFGGNRRYPNFAR